MSDDYPYLVCDSWSYRFKSEPVMGYFKTRTEAEESARRRNRADPRLTNGLPRYRVFEMHDEGEAQELPL